MENSLMADVFISYSSKDKPIARDLHRLLSEVGVDVWFDEVALVPGTRWDTALRDAIEGSKSVLMLVGKQPAGQWQTDELRTVLNRALSDDRFRVIPVLLPGSTLENLPPALRAYQPIDLRTAPDEESML